VEVSTRKPLIMDKKRPLEGDYDGDRPAKQPKLAEVRRNCID